VTESYVEKLAFTRVCLSCVRLTMTIMCVPLVELLCKAAMGQFQALDYMLSGARGLLWPRPILRGNKCYRFPRPWCW
jgi:hypothetical protein